MKGSKRKRIPDLDSRETKGTTIYMYIYIYTCINIKSVVSYSISDKQMLCVTGGGSGIGCAVCQALAKEGAAVAAADINWKQVEETVKLLDTGTFLLM